MPSGHTPDEPTPLDPSTEKLFGLGTEAWVDRLRNAQTGPPLGKLGAYELLGEVGRGGQGEVYRAVQPGTGRIVAIKRVAGLGLTPDAALLARFTREVEALTRLSHPNVVTVHTLDAVDGHTVLVMEFVDGRHIDQWSDAQWARSSDPVNTILSAFASTCDGVAHAHQRGVIHRDIKPSNILVTGEDQPKVLDFGIARILGDQAAAGATAWTMTGFAGTPAYASPEQLEPGGGIDTRSDVYSLGVLLFRMLTGKEAFEGSIAEAAKRKTQGPAPAPSRARADVPHECDWIVRKATDPDPARRYQSVDALADDVRRQIDGYAIVAHPPSVLYTFSRAVRRRPYLTTAIVGTVLTISALGIVTAIQAARLSIKNEQLGKTVARAEAGEATAKTEAAAHAEAVAAVTQAIQSLSHQIMYNPYLHRADAANAFVRAMEPRADRLPPESGMRFHAQLRLLYEATGDHNQSLVHAQKALAACLTLTGDPRREECGLRLRLSFALRKVGQFVGGIAEAKRALEVATAVFGQSSSAVIDCHREIGQALAGTDVHAAIAEVRRAKALTEVKNPVDAASLDLYLVPWLSAINRHEQAIREGMASINLLDKAGQGSKKIALMLRYRVALIHVEIGQIAEAAKLLEFVVRVRTTRDPVTYVRRLEAVRLYAEVLVRLGRYQDSIPHYEHAIGIYQTSDPKGTRIARLRFLSAAAHSALGKHDQARPLFYLAASRGGHDGAREGSAKFDADVKLLVEALKAGDWRVDPSLNDRLGKFAWLGPTPLMKSLSGGPDDEPESDIDIDTPSVQSGEN